MGKRIAVESQLSNIKEYLKQKGYEVVELKETLSEKNNLNVYDAIVITGQSRNMLGIDDISTKVPVIDATGMSPFDVEESIKRL
ncbi:YkuS family protein [Thermoanaerobacter sp. A7A]|uniref:YkuS family protein n=1 Tax=Thermoanaerobacter sp. A7A TaxID=1350366 RepID=UPI000406D262|nr:YkuS family protein [Thermoanaerobacter sp. A7A]